MFLEDVCGRSCLSDVDNSSDDRVKPRVPLRNDEGPSRVVRARFEKRKPCQKMVGDCHSKIEGQCLVGGAPSFRDSWKQLPAQVDNLLDGKQTTLSVSSGRFGPNNSDQRQMSETASIILSPSPVLTVL